MSEKSCTLIAGLTPGGIGISIGRELVHDGYDIVYTVQSGRLLKVMNGRSFSEAEKSHVEGCRVYPCDFLNDEDLPALIATLKEEGVRVENVIHSVAYANPKTAMGNGWMAAPWDDVGAAFKVSVCSLTALVHALLEAEILQDGGMVLAMTYDPGMVSPRYGWMTTMKGALEANIRSLAEELGQSHQIAVIGIAAGPLSTVAARSIPDAHLIGEPWDALAPLGWDLERGKRMVAEFVSNIIFCQGISGQILHVDGGAHCVRFPRPEEERKKLRGES